MKKILLVILFIALTGQAWGAKGPYTTYYVCQSAARGGTGQTIDACMSVATHNGKASDYFAGGDTIYLCDIITSTVTPKSSGTNRNPIIYRGDLVGHVGSIDGTGKTNCINIDGKSDINIKNITVANAVRNIRGAGVTNRITVQGITTSNSGGSNAAEIWFDAGDGIIIAENTINQGKGYILAFVNSKSSYCTNAQIIKNTVLGTPNNVFTSGFYLYKSDALTFNGNTITDITLSAASSIVVNYITISGLTVMNNILGTVGHGNNGIGMKYTSCSGIVSSGNIISYQGGEAYNYVNSSGTSTIDTAAYAGKNGFLGQGTSNITFYGSIAHNVADDGFSITNSTTYNCWQCKSYDNGITSNTASGDGYTTHLTSTMNLYYCTGWGNQKSGASMTGASTGVIYNCTFYNNYEATNADDFGIYINGSGAWDIRNNITANHRYEIYIFASGADGSLTINNNVYYDSRGGNAFYFNGNARNWTKWKADLATSAKVLGKDLSSVNADPKFKNPSINDFRLQINSPARCLGTDVSLADDYTGFPDPRIDCISAGAYQF